MEIIEKDISIGKTKNEQMAAGWDCLIQIVEEFQNISLKLRGLSHTIKGFRANIVSNEFHEH